MKLYSAQESAEHLNVSLSTFKRLIKKFGVQAVKTLEKGKKFYSNLQLGILRDLLVGKKTFIKNSGVSIVSNLTTISASGVSNFKSGVSMSENLSSNPQQNAKFNLSKNDLKQFEKTEMKPITELVLPIDKFSDWIFDQTKICDTTKMSEGVFKGKSISSRITFKFGGGLLVPFDKTVLLALNSEYNADNEFVSLQRLFETLGGGNHLTDKMKVELLKSVRKLMETYVKIDMTELVQNCYKSKITTVEGMLLPCKIVTTEINSKITEGTIHLLGNSPIFQVADIKKQIMRLPCNLISALPLRSTESTISLAWFLLKRVGEIVGSNSAERKKRVHKLSTSILFETIFEKCGFTGLDKEKRRNLLNNIKKILEHFQNYKLIPSFEIIKKNGKNYSIEVL